MLLLPQRVSPLTVPATALVHLSTSAMSQLQQLDCFSVLLATVCNATVDQEANVRPFVPVLLGAAQRCVGYQPPPAVNCPNGNVIPVDLPSDVAGAGAPAAEAVGAGAPAAEAPMPEMGMPVVAGAPAVPGDNPALPGAGP